MLQKKKEHPKEKIILHPRNKHRERYNFKQLINTSPALAPFVKLNKYNDQSIDFFDAAAVKMLNKALLKCYYNIDYWDIPANYLCPPIPGRVDYIHYAADLLSSKNNGIIPTSNKIKCLDIGTGANCIYPIIGITEYGWLFTGSDIDPVSIEAANKIIELNSVLKGKVELRLQTNTANIFSGIIQKDELFDLAVCNPPFHASATEARAGTLKKLNNLKRRKITKPVLNFGGSNNELWCEGGLERFVKTMINESTQFTNSCFWFTALISKSEYLESIYESLKKSGAIEVKTISMGQGNKISRIVAWTFLTAEKQKKWSETRWGGNLSLKI
jgi:23S rRNA (adenine1618-N6)-methyltransferase